LYNGVTVVNTNRDGNGGFTVNDKDTIQILILMNDGESATSQLDEDGTLIYDESAGKAPRVLDSGIIIINGGSIYIATGVILGK
jgi:hypothetical protein